MDFSFHGDIVTPNGTMPEIGEKFPSFTVVDKDNKNVSLQDLITDKTLLISVVPDIDTRVCSIQTKHFNTEVDGHSEVNFVTISTNTIAEQTNWCAAENVKNMRMLSDENHNFGDAVGLFIPEKGIDLRSIWVINTDGTTTYKEVMKEQSTEPNYAMVLDHIDENYSK